MRNAVCVVASPITRNNDKKNYTVSSHNSEILRTFSLWSIHINVLVMITMQLTSELKVYICVYMYVYKIKAL